MRYTGGMGKAVYIVIQFTWGILQSLAGLGVLIAHARYPHCGHHGAIVTDWPSRYGLSLGPFVFIPQAFDAEEHDLVLVHEYGHTMQSLAENKVQQENHVSTLRSSPLLSRCPCNR